MRHPLHGRCSRRTSNFPKVLRRLAINRARPSRSTRRRSHVEGSRLRSSARAPCCQSPPIASARICPALWSRIGKRRVVHRHDRRKSKKRLQAIAAVFAAHREAVADRHEADLRLVELVDQRHVAENVSVAHVVERRLPGRLSRSGRADCRDRRAGRPMSSDEECSALTKETVNPPQSTVPPWLPGLIFSTPWPASHIADLEAADEHRACRPCRSRGVADMVVMAVRQQHVRRALRRPSFASPLKAGLPSGKGRSGLARCRIRCGRRSVRTRSASWIVSSLVL